MAVVAGGCNKICILRQPQLARAYDVLDVLAAGADMEHMSFRQYSLSKRQFVNLIKIIIHQFDCDYNYFDDDDDDDDDNWMHFG